MIVTFLQNTSRKMTTPILLKDGNTIYLPPLDILRNVEIADGQNLTGVSFKESIPAIIKEVKPEIVKKYISGIPVPVEISKEYAPEINLPVKTEGANKVNPELSYLKDLSEITNIIDKTDLSEIVPKKKEKSVSEINHPVKRKYKRRKRKSL